MTLPILSPCFTCPVFSTAGWEVLSVEILSLRHVPHAGEAAHSVMGSPVLFCFSLLGMFRFLRVVVLLRSGGLR